MQVDAGLKFFVWLIIVIISGVAAYVAGSGLGPVVGILIFLAGLVVAWLASASIRMVAQWQRAVVLRLGKYVGTKGPGLFFITPLIESVSTVIDLRTITSTFKAEQTITADTVPVDVDAVLFWRVIDVEKAALEVQAYDQAVGWASQTALRDVIGRSTLADILSGRDKIDSVLREIIDHRTEPWGIRVESVEIRDVVIPNNLQDAMSRQAQAERERQARIILGESESQIAHKFMEAAALYATNPIALHLRAMNMLYEGMKDKGSLIIVPSSALETMNLGVTNLAALKGMAEQAGASVPAAAVPALGPQPSPPVGLPPFPGLDL